MKLGDQVQVWQEDKPDLKAVGTVTTLSSNERSIAVAFADSPPFLVSGTAGVAIDPEHGIMLLASRQPDGSYHEVFGRIRYHIEGV